jgi:hypothetical protein
MTAVATPPKVEVREFSERDPRTGNTEHFTAVVGLPSLPEGRRVIILKPLPGRPKDYQYEEEINGGLQRRSWSSERHFVGSLNFPEGLELGVVNFFTDIGQGQPYIERSEFQCGTENYAVLRAYARGERYFTMGERRRLYAQAERTKAEANAAQPTPAGAPVAPAPAAASPVDLDALIERRVNEKLRKMGLLDDPAAPLKE